MALSADRDLKFFVSQELIEIPVKDNVCIYKGALVGRDRSTGYARPLTAGDDFLGVAFKQADNTVGDHIAGGISVKLHQHVDVIHALSGVSSADIGRAVYASDDTTLVTYSFGGSRIGRVVAVEGTGLARIRCQPVMSGDGVGESEHVILLSDESQTLTLDHINKTLVVSNSAAVTLTLPAVATVRAGGRLRIVKLTDNAYAVTLDANASETIDGSATFAAINAKYDVAELLCTGTEWVIVSRDIA